METHIDTHNRISGTQLEHILKLQLKALEKNPELAKVLPPLMVWGAPGLGKSSILQKAAKDLGIGFIDVRLAQREPVDIRGLPVPKGDRVEWLVSADWPRDPESKGIILFDEITAADRSLQVAAYEFILDRRLGELYKVPDGWYICAAGNRTEDRAVRDQLLRREPPLAATGASPCLGRTVPSESTRRTAQSSRGDRHERLDDR